MRRLLKFKNGKDGVLVKYETVEKGVVGDTITLETEDLPLVTLKDALQAMVPDLLAICELSSVPDKDLEVTGITLTYNDETGNGIVLTGLRKLKKIDAPLVLNSPHTTEYSVRCQVHIEELEREVFSFVDGAREQLKLDFAEPAREPAGVAG